jgi:hypothetical protein
MTVNIVAAENGSACQSKPSWEQSPEFFVALTRRLETRAKVDAGV